MTRSFLRLLKQKNAATKRLWRTELSKSVRRELVPHPGQLTRMMDRSLEELFSFWLFTKRPTLPSKPLDLLYPENRSCTVSLYIDYLLAGEMALREVIKSISPELPLSETEISDQESELLFSFRILHHKEVNEFCEHCVHNQNAASFPPLEMRPRICLRKLQNLSSNVSPTSLPDRCD